MGGGSKMRVTYLGDGVYARIDLGNEEYPVILTTGTHHLNHADQVIYLDKVAIETLLKEYLREENPVVL